MTVKIEPESIAQAVDLFVDKHLRDVAKYENRTTLDESAVWELHDLAAEIYATAWEDATRAAEQRWRYRHQRDADRKAATEESAP